MAITLYTISGAPRPWRVSLGLCFKGLPFETVVLKASVGEHKSRAFLSLNPRGTVPVLVDHGVTVCDSLAALAWLDRSYPETPILGSNPDEAARIWGRMTDSADHLRSAIDQVLTPIFFEGATSASPKLLTSAYKAKVELAGLEKLLRESPFLAGATPSAADAVAFPEVRLLQRASDTKPDIMREIGLQDFYGQFPELGAWAARIEALPGYTQTQPHHWKDVA